jgi:hypothetical protein
MQAMLQTKPASSRLPGNFAHLLSHAVNRGQLVAGDAGRRPVAVCSFDQQVRAWTSPVLVMAPMRRFGPEEYSDGTKPR